MKPLRRKLPGMVAACACLALGSACGDAPAANPPAHAATSTASKIAVRPTATLGTPTPVVGSARTMTAPEPLADPFALAEPLYRLPAGLVLALVNVDMVDRLHGWAFGGDPGLARYGHVLLTADGGSTWKDVSPPEYEPVLGEGLTAFGDFANGKIGWVVFSLPEPHPIPAYPVVWRTADGGATWTYSDPLPTDGLRESFRIASIEFTGEKFGWLLVYTADSEGRERPVLYRTTDSGRTWTLAVAPWSEGIAPCRVTGMLLQDSMQGWLTGDCGPASAQPFLFRTADGGETWARILLPAPPSEPAFFTDAERWCEVGSSTSTMGAAVFILLCHDGTGAAGAPKLYLSADRGLSWLIRSFPGGRIRYTPDGSSEAWALGKDLFWTEDGGSSWERIARLEWDGDFDFINGLEGWLAIGRQKEDALLRTVDGGRTWSALVPRTVQP